MNGDHTTFTIRTIKLINIHKFSYFLLQNIDSTQKNKSANYADKNGINNIPQLRENRLSFARIQLTTQRKKKNIISNFLVSEVASCAMSSMFNILTSYSHNMYVVNHTVFISSNNYYFLINDDFSLIHIV